MLHCVFDSFMAHHFGMVLKGHCCFFFYSHVTKAPSLTRIAIKMIGDIKARTESAPRILHMDTESIPKTSGSQTADLILTPLRQRVNHRERYKGSKGRKRQHTATLVGTTKQIISKQSNHTWRDGSVLYKNTSQFWNSKM